MKTIMILGGSILQLPAIIKAKEMGLNVIVADMNPDAIGFNQDGIIPVVVSTTDTVGVLQYAKKYNIDGIMTLASDVPMPTIATVCEELNLVGISKQTALNSTNKAEMRDRFAENNVPIPVYKYVRSEQEFIAASKVFTGRFVVKPSDNSGNRGIRIVENINNEKELLNAYAYASGYTKDGRVLLEEYMDGPEFSVEGFTIDGIYKVVQITDKITSGKPYFVELGHTQPSQFDESTLNEISKVAQKGVSALGINIGPSHTEIKLTREGPKIVEIGARLGGGCITTHLVPLSTGVDMVKANIESALGLTPNVNHQYEKGAAIRFFTPSAGIFSGVEGLEKANNIDGVVEVNFFKNIGDEIPTLRNGLDRTGYVIAQGTTREEAVLICEKAKNQIKIITK